MTESFAVDALQESFIIFDPERDQQDDVVALPYLFLDAAAERPCGRPAVPVLGRGLLALFPSVAGWASW